MEENDENKEALLLGAEHQVVKYTLEEDVKIWEYLYRFTRDPEIDFVEKFRGPSPVSYKFWQKYVDETGSSRKISSLQLRYHRIIRKLHKMPFGMEMKLDLYYSLSIPVPEEFVEIALREANILMDEQRNIEAFEMKSNEQLQKERELEEQMQKEREREEHRQKERELEEKKQKEQKLENTKKRSLSETMKTEGQNPATPATKRQKTNFKDVDAKIWKFLLEKITDPETGVIKKDETLNPKSLKFWYEYLGNGADKSLAGKYNSHYRTLAKNLHKMSFDIRTKADLYYGLKIPVDSQFLELISNKTTVHTDENGCISEYNSEDLQDKHVRMRMY